MTHAELGEMLDYIADNPGEAMTQRLRRLLDEVVRLRGVIMRKQYGVFKGDCDCVMRQFCAWCDEPRLSWKIKHDDDCLAFTTDGVVK